MKRPPFIPGSSFPHGEQILYIDLEACAAQATTRYDGSSANRAALKLVVNRR